MHLFIFLKKHLRSFLFYFFIRIHDKIVTKRKKGCGRNCMKLDDKQKKKLFLLAVNYMMMMKRLRVQWMNYAVSLRQPTGKSSGCLHKKGAKSTLLLI